MKNSAVCFLTLKFFATGLSHPFQKLEGDPGEYSVEEDMYLPVSPLRPLQRGMLQNRVWPNNTIPYVIRPNFTDAERSVITNGLAAFEKYTCVQFVPRGEEKTYVDIFKGKGCWSVIGHNQGSDGLKLSLQSPGCIGHRTVVHEAMHALGFLHEQNREDRDFNVIVLLDNAGPNENGAMKSYRAASLGIPYNVESVMQYGPTGFSTNGESTIVSTRLHHPIDATKIPWSDFRRVNRLYGCPPSHEAALDRLEYDD